MKTTIVYRKTESDSLERPGNGLSGYRVDLEITEVLNITDAIFIMQREVPNPDLPDTYEDTFYSVASVAQLESVGTVPSLDNPFYRVNAISLVFPNPEELKLYTDRIILLIGKLQKANDALINMQDPTTGAFPSDTLARYWGLVSAAAVTDEDLEAGSVDYVYDKILSKTLQNDGGPRYVYVALRADLSAITALKINAATIATTLVTRAVVNANGYSASYNIYRTNTTTSASTIILETT